jgi:AcrR family transcriptional regulator
MSRLAAKRKTHLTRAEIAKEALRQFDTRTREPSIRGLAAELRVAPTAIYHHFPSQAAIHQAAVELVWGEAATGLLDLVPKPLAADPADVLVAAGVATRRAWLSHHRLARYMAATPEANAFTTNALALMANVFARLGLEADHAARCFHSYASFMIGAVLFAADRVSANERLERGTPERRSSERTRLSIDAVMDLSVVDPARDEELFVEGLRRLIESFRA